METHHIEEETAAAHESSRKAKQENFLPSFQFSSKRHYSVVPSIIPKVRHNNIINQTERMST